ncbi:2-dehydro-3-deoxy-D-gluconate 5-dehydrogenase KduD [Jeotgalibaca ciconiae]|nr:2-dehydro-3-deoxy-D-gluconate 5-dehydrogenase KduD [Jeotgalibaca ciconiae]
MDIQDFSMEFFNLKGKVAIVTGGNKGIGQGYVLALTKAGADIFATARSGELEETIEMVEACGCKIEFLRIDLTEKEAEKRIVDGAIKAFGHIDILVNNAGTIRRTPLLEYSEKDWNDVMDVNLNSVFKLSQEAAKYFAVQKSGKIINVASMLSFQGGKFVPPYAASKHGVVGLTKAFANELSEHNVQVNAIAPGYVRTENTEPILEDDERKDEITSRIPAGRWADPIDLMGTVVFLASHASDYVTGHVLPVDGGWLSN